MLFVLFDFFKIAPPLLPLVFEIIRGRVCGAEKKRLLTAFFFFKYAFAFLVPINGRERERVVRWQGVPSKLVFNVSTLANGRWMRQLAPPPWRGEWGKPTPNNEPANAHNPEYASSICKGGIGLFSAFWVAMVLRPWDLPGL